LSITAAGVLFLAKDTGRCLLQLREADKRQRHTWGFFGGTLEQGETPYQAIQRELAEEIGLVPEIEKLNPIDVFQSKDRNFYYYSFVAVVDNEFHPVLNNESAGYAWVDIGKWPQPLHQGARATLQRNGGTDKLHTIWEIHNG
jgi:8-oxo-dGTP pyrophosphatase MutT (NUDIX family)